jgi:hypothetical protein
MAQSLVPLRDLLKQQNIGVGGIQKDQKRHWVLDLGGGRRLRLIPQKGGTYRMELHQSDGTVASLLGDARLINGHFVLDQQSADNLRRLLGGVVKSTSQPTEGSGPAGGGDQSKNGVDTVGGSGGGLVYAGQFPSVDDVLARLLPTAGGTALVAGGQSGQQSQQSQQPSRSRSWLEELTGLLEKIGPWLVLAMMMRQDRQSQTQPIILG